MTSIDLGDFDGVDGSRLTGEYHAELRRRFPSDYDPANGLPARASDLRPPNGVFLLAWNDSSAIGCGGPKRVDSTTGEIKHMFVMPAHRGGGIGAAILDALKREGVKMGFERVVLDTSEHLPEAIRLYRRSGSVEIDSYNSNHYATHWFGKQLI